MPVLMVLNILLNFSDNCYFRDIKFLKLLLMSLVENPNNKEDNNHFETIDKTNKVIETFSSLSKKSQELLSTIKMSEVRLQRVMDKNLPVNNGLRQWPIQEYFGSENINKGV